VPPLSHAVQEVVQILAVFCLGLVDSPMDLPRVGRLGGRCLAGFLALGEDLIDVVVVCHAVSMAPYRRPINHLSASFSSVTVGR